MQRKEKIVELLHVTIYPFNLIVLITNMSAETDLLLFKP